MSQSRRGVPFIREERHPHLVASLVVGGLGLVVLQVFRTYFSPTDDGPPKNSPNEPDSLGKQKDIGEAYKNHGKNDRSSSPNVTTANADKTPTTTASFPWEGIREAPNSSGRAAGMAHTAVRRESSRANSRSDNSNNDKHEENFFASMTFANSGLRMPSCPCCQ